MYLYKFGQNIPTGSEDSARKADFYSLYTMVTLIIRSRSPNLINSALCHNDTIYTVRPEFITLFKRKQAEIQFWSKILHFKVLV